MNRQAQIHAFTLVAHQWLLPQFGRQPEWAAEARGVIRRWQQQAGGASHCDPYWNEWDQLLSQGPAAVEAAVCVDTDHAATLRSVSPLGRFLPAEERHRLLRQVRSAA